MEIVDLVRGGESYSLEFKSSFRYDYASASVNKDLTKAVAKTVAGFLNGKGGTLLIGVSDDGQILGIERDIQTLPRQDRDGFEQVLRSGLGKHLGPEVSPFVDTTFHSIDESVVVAITCQPHEGPIWFREGDRIEFYVRDGNSTRPLDMRAAYEYIRIQWPPDRQEPISVASLQDPLNAVAQEQVRSIVAESLRAYSMGQVQLPIAGRPLPTWIRVQTVRVLDLFLGSLARATTWRQVYIISPWISHINETPLPTSTLLKRLQAEGATAYVITRPPLETWHHDAIDAWGHSSRANVALIPELHMKLFVAVTAETTFAMIGSANFTTQSLTNREIGVLVSSTGEGASVIKRLRYEAAQVYRSSARSLVHKADFRHNR